MMDRFTTFRSTFEALKVFPAEDMKRAYIMMGEYALDGILPEPEGTAAYGLFLSIKPLIDTSVKRSESGRAGGRAKQNEANSKQNKAKCKQTESKPKQSESNPEPKIKDKRINEKETLSIESAKKKFTPPTAEQVKGYAEEMGYTIDAERFVDFYASKGWMVGKTKMSDWKAAVRNWGRSQRQESTANGNRQELTAGKKNAFTNFPQRDYDFDELERRLLSAQG